MPVGLLHRGGVWLTVVGLILKLVERPLMHVSLFISENGVVSQTDVATVSKLSIKHAHTHALTRHRTILYGNSCDSFVTLTFLSIVWVQL